MQILENKSNNINKFIFFENMAEYFENEKMEIK